MREHGLTDIAIKFMLVFHKKVFAALDIVFFVRVISSALTLDRLTGCFIMKNGN